MLNRVSAGVAAVKRGETQDGVPYVFGGETWNVELDCRGLYILTWNPLIEALNTRLANKAALLEGNTYTLFNQYVFDQRNKMRDVPCQPGDGLFIQGADPGPNGEPGHVMIYVSPGQVLQAEMTGTLVGIFPFDTDNGWQFRCRPANAFPLPPPPNPAAPTGADLVHAGLVQISEESALTATLNGWTLWRWAQAINWFAAYSPPHPIAPWPDFALYANKNWQSKRPAS